MKGFSVLIADGSAVFRKMFAKAVAETADAADITVTVTATPSGSEVGAMLSEHNYSIVIIDAEISEPGSIELLKIVKKVIPNAYTLVTARPSVVKDKKIIKASSEFASEFMIKPIEESYNNNFDIVKDKVQSIYDIVSRKSQEKVINNEKAAVESRKDKKNAKSSDSNASFFPDIVLIAASTGGPTALKAIIPQFPADFPVPIVIVQHIPLHFTGTLVHQLDSSSLLRVKVAENGERIVAGTIYFAPGGIHMSLSNKKIILDGTVPVNGVCPAADVLFQSVAESYMFSSVLAVILTGMGSDGRDGVVGIKQKKVCFCLAQSESSSVVFGMPRAVVEDGLADRVLDLDDIAQSICEYCDYSN